MRAFAGECQARTRYLLAADGAEREGCLTVCRAFRQTAKEEEAHARAFYRLLAPLAGSQIEFTAAYPVTAATWAPPCGIAQTPDFRFLHICPE